MTAWVSAASTLARVEGPQGASDAQGNAAAPTDEATVSAGPAQSEADQQGTTVADEPSGARGYQKQATRGQAGSKHGKQGRKAAKKTKPAVNKEASAHKAGKPGDGTASDGGKQARPRAKAELIHHQRLVLPGGLVLVTKVIGPSLGSASVKQPHKTVALQAPQQGQAERESKRQELLKRFDANGNGQLDPDEREAARKAMQQRKGKRGNQPQPGAPGGALRQELLKRFDANGNGQLDPDEREAARKAMQQRKGKPGAKKQKQGTSPSNQPENQPPAANATAEKEATAESRNGRATEDEPARESELERSLLKQFDFNGNGQLDDDERRAARKALAERQSQSSG